MVALRVLFLTNGFGGNEIAALRVLSELRDLGASVTTATLHDIPRLRGAIQSRGFSSPGGHRRAEASRLLLIASSLLNACKYVLSSRLNAEVVYVYTPFWGYEWATSALARTARIRLCKLILSKASPLRIGLLAPYHHMFDGWSMRKGLDFVLPNVVESNAYRAPHSDDGGISLYCIGRVDFAQKWQDRLLMLFVGHISPSARSNAELHFIGDGPDAETLSRLANGHGQVLLHGWKTKPLALNKNPVVVLGSRFEGLPLVALEALTSGIPVIATRGCGLESLLPAPCFFDYQRPATAIAALDYVRAHRASIVTTGRDKVLELYSAPRLSELAGQFISSLAAR